MCRHPVFVFNAQFQASAGWFLLFHAVDDMENVRGLLVVVVVTAAVLFVAMGIAWIFAG